jgi:DNA-binding CsgD family transcriptional regulator
MERLRASDLEGALRFVHEASAEAGPEPFPAHVLQGLRTLLDCEWASYCELDRRERRLLALVEAPVPDEISDDDNDIFWRIVDQHPLCVAQKRGRFDALKISDFHSRRELHRLELYAEWLRPSGVEFEMEAAIPSPMEHTKTFLFDDGRRDFSERDRALLNLLQPHLVQLYRAAVVRRFADSARAVLEDGRDLGEQGVLVLDPRGRIEVASPHGRRLIDDYAGGIGTRLPATVAEWLARRPSTALSIDGPAGTLVIELDRRGSADVLLLTERAAPDSDPAALSTREREVLALVRDGLRNAEIAEALWVSPGTVRKHLENIYEKLGVHTRTAAVARMHGLD